MALSHPSVSEVQAYWNAASEWYIESAEVSALTIYSALLPVIDTKNAHKICDVACGSGREISLLLSLLPQDSEIWASDISDAMVDKALQRNLPRTHIIQASNDALPYIDNNFDRYIANLSLMYVPDASLMIREAWRVLAPGGIAIFSVWGRREHCTLEALWEQALFDVVGSQAKSKRSPFYLSDSGELKSLVKNCGFNKVFSYFTAAPFAGTGFEETMSFYAHFPRVLAIKNQYDESTFQRFWTRLTELVQEIVEKEEVLMFDVQVVLAYK
ncbi:unnamed protein product [Blepharisma stoltei]|uniref:Methyltransferase type 11 domain-containing protein n=1 Tax=Blepharisma stoltei TaxID=1481888 RepID=A0AAU9ICG8_9CILI|nr:unnamed protein product [Blepharisma stoltei]